MTRDEALAAVEERRTRLLVDVEALPEMRDLRAAEAVLARHEEAAKVVWRAARDAIPADATPEFRSAAMHAAENEKARTLAPYVEIREDAARALYSSARYQALVRDGDREIRMLREAVG